MLIAFLIQFIAYLSFVWAAIFFFRSTKSDKKQFSIVLIQLVGTIAILYNLWATRKSYWSWTSIFGVSLITISILIFWFAIKENRKRPLAFAFSEHKPGPVVTGGPYGVVRHPFYLSYSLAWMGAFLVTESIISLICGLILIYLYVRAARAEEAELVSGAFGDAYVEYQKITGMFLPKLKRK